MISAKLIIPAFIAGAGTMAFLFLTGWTIKTLKDDFDLFVQRGEKRK